MKRLQLSSVMTKEDISLQVFQGWKQQEGRIYYFTLFHKDEKNCMKGQAKNKVPESALSMTFVAYHNFVFKYSHQRNEL